MDRWLAGTAHDQLTNPYASGAPQYQRAPGTVRDVGSPAEQTFWLASASGTGTVVLDWTPTNGQFAVVLARADGAAGVTARARVAVRVPDLAPIGIGLLVGGGLLLVGALVLTYLGAAGIGRRHTTPPVPGRTASPAMPGGTASPAPPAVRVGAGVGG